MKIPHNIQDLAFSKAETLDLLELIYNRREACRISFEEGEDFRPLLQAMDELKLPYSINELTHTSSDLYGSTQSTDAQNDAVDIYIAKSPTQLETIQMAFRIQDHQLIGRLFGYPECCIGSFLSGMSDTSLEMPFLTEAFIKTIASGNFQYLKIMSPLIPNNTLSFFPCDFDCDKAVEKARWRANYREEIFGEKVPPTTLEFRNSQKIHFIL
jgi:hypothetical protein